MNGDTLDHSSTRTALCHRCRKHVTQRTWYACPHLENCPQNWPPGSIDSQDAPQLTDNRPCRFCGYEFDHDSLGKYGCPNCHAEGLSEPPPNSLPTTKTHPPSTTEGQSEGGMLKA